MDLHLRQVQEITCFHESVKVSGLSTIPQHPNWLVVVAASTARWSTYGAPFKKGEDASIPLSRSPRVIKIYDTRTCFRVAMFPIPAQLHVNTVTAVAL